MLYVVRYVYRPVKDPGEYSLVLYHGQRVTKKGNIVEDKGICVFHSVEGAMSESNWPVTVVYDGQTWAFTDMSIVPVSQGEEGAIPLYWATQRHIILEEPETVD